MTVKLGLKLHGEGRDALVLLHGFGGSAAVWSGLVSMLPRGAAIFAYDLPGHGGSLHAEGAGSAKARTEARAHWKATVARLYGPRYADFRNAQNRQWDCKKGAILLAKCVIVASPCRY